MAIPVPACNDGPNELLRKILIGLPEVGTGGGGNDLEIDDEGVPLTLAATSIDFVGAGVTATVVGTDVTVTIPLAGGSAPSNATYITQTPDATLTNEQALSLLATGYMKVTTGTGVVTSQAIPIPVADGGTGTSTAFTPGSVIFAGPAGVFAQDNPNFFWDDTNNFHGIGNNVPVAELHVASSSAADPRGIMTAQHSTDTNAARLHFRKSRGTMAAPTIVVTGDNLGRQRYAGYDGANYLQMASITVNATGTIALTRVPTNMVFSTATDATPSVLTERWRIEPTGSFVAVTDNVQDIGASGATRPRTGYFGTSLLIGDTTQITITNTSILSNTANTLSIGTTTARNIILRTNNVNRWAISSTGIVQTGTGVGSTTYTATPPVSGTHRGVDGSGVDGAGSIWNVSGGVGTGTAENGSFVIQGTTPGASSAVLNTAVDRWVFNGRGDVVITPGIRTTGSPTLILLTAPAHTTLTATVEATDVNFNITRTVQFNTGAIVAQRAVIVGRPTYGFVAASTITDAASFYVRGAPIAGTNATITRTNAIWSDGNLMVSQTGVPTRNILLSTVDAGSGLNYLMSSGVTTFEIGTLTAASYTTIIGAASIRFSEVTQNQYLTLTGASSAVLFSTGNGGFYTFRSGDNNGNAQFIFDHNSAVAPASLASFQRQGVNQIYFTPTGSIVIDIVGSGYRTKEGANAKQGISTLVAGTVTVANTSVTATSRIFLTIQAPNAGTPSFVYISARTAATSFVITSGLATDTSDVAWEIFEPA